MIFHTCAAYQCRDPLKNTRILSLLKVSHIIDQVQGFLIIPYSRNHYHVTGLRYYFLTNSSVHNIFCVFKSGASCSNSFLAIGISLYIFVRTLDWRIYTYNDPIDPLAPTPSWLVVLIKIIVR